MKELYDIWFSCLDMNHNTKVNLLEQYTAEEIFNLEVDDLKRNKMSENEIVKIIKSKNLEEARKMLEYMINKKIQLISIRDDRYPTKLHNIDDKPAYFYLRGNEKILDEDNVRNCWLQISHKCWKKDG